MKVNVNESRIKKEKIREELLDDVTHECFTLYSEEPKNRFIKLVELLCLEYLNMRKRKRDKSNI